MHLPLSLEQASELSILDETGSTNDELAARSSSAATTEFSVIVTTNQTAGRGRLGRVWVAPPGKTLAISVLLRPRLAGGEPLALEHFGWLPLLAGVAMSRAVAELLPAGAPVSLKWPNDVLIGGLKVCGILAELLPGGDAVVLGAGVNLTIENEELPTPTSTSLLLSGATLRGDELVDAVLAAYLRGLRSAYESFLLAGADPVASGLRQDVLESCSTLGQRVKVDLPGGKVLVGTAIDVDETGRLRVRSSEDESVQAVAAGDVTHLRYE